MPDLGRSGEYVQSLGTRVHDAVTVAAGSEDAILALQGLTLTILRRPIADITEIYDELNRFDRTEQRYIEIGRATGDQWEEEIGSALNLAFASMSLPYKLMELPRPPSLAPTTALALSLATGIELWRQESRRVEDGLQKFPDDFLNGRLWPRESRRVEDGLLLAFTVATPDSADSELVRLTFAEPRAVLVLRPRSLEVGLIWDGIVRARYWAVSLVRGALGRVRSAEAAARAFVTNLRAARETQEPKPLPLIRLDDGHSVLPTGANGSVVLFLHGLMSTDLGTFDGFMRRWLDPRPSDLPPALLEKQPQLTLREELPEAALVVLKQAVTFVGWPHDTLTSIDQNAHDLARWIDERIGILDCKIAFVCHSRGGLVARAAAEKLYVKNKKWERRICSCITFGTPHTGVALAEHPDRRLGAYVLSGLSRKDLAAFIDMAAYLEQRTRVEGIEDLQPPNAPNEPFLRKLERLEWEKAPAGRLRRLDIYAVGGVAKLGATGGPLLERLGRLYEIYQAYYAGESEHDLVVPFSSATAANRANSAHEPIRIDNCDHFSYFSDEACKSEAFSTAIRSLWDCFGLTDAIAPFLKEPPGGGPPDLDKPFGVGRRIIARG